MTLPCSAASLAVGEPLAATAPAARCWIVIEQPGPWGRQALSDSHLDPALGTELAARAQRSGLTVLLARHPDRPERAWDPSTRRVWVAFTAPGGTRMREGVLADPAALLDWDVDAMAGGQLPPFGRRTDDPLLLVCTHSGRDACCAVHGRALVDALQPSDRVWECSHLGGHRFAPTVLSLPDGYAYGRLDSVAAAAVRQAAQEGLMRLDACRGRTSLPAALQAADLAVRAHAHETASDAIDVLRLVAGRPMPAVATARIDEDEVACEVRHADGRAWRVTVRRDATGAVRIESCMGEPHAVVTWTATTPEAVNPWRTTSASGSASR